MNKLAIRAIVRMIDVIIEQLGEIAYAHRASHPDTDVAACKARRLIRDAKELLFDVMEACDGE